ncbi:hypothetical protein SFA32_08185 [Buttiauxella sp. HR94]|nr:hypothetical protein SFA32_08185 [Buttiauxella sp. HR94]
MRLARTRESFSREPGEPLLSGGFSVRLAHIQKETRMKYLSPQQAMLGIRVVLTDNGMIIKIP